jgi:hypothetical protein
MIKPIWIILGLFKKIRSGLCVGNELAPSKCCHSNAKKVAIRKFGRMQFA